MILLRKIMKNTSVSNLNLARSAMKRLFAQPQSDLQDRLYIFNITNFCYEKNMHLPIPDLFYVQNKRN